MLRHSATRNVSAAAALVLLACVTACTNATPARSQQVAVDSIQTSSFATLSARLAEPGGFFDTDNLISNEASYLHVLGALREQGVHGGTYIGVGPGQNFSYIAAIRPDIAFIVDIRRDNLLQHLLYKALFAISARRVDFLGALVGRDVSNAPDDVVDWPVDEIVRLVDDAAPSAELTAQLVATVRREVGRFGMNLSDSDFATIERFHGSFIRHGLDLQFNTFGRAPQPYYPTLRALLLERDLDGNLGNYLASERDFRFVKEMQRRNLVIPVVGNLAGHHAVRAIGDWSRERGLTVSAFYTSNVEFYLWGDGTFPQFVDNVETLPRDDRSVIIRSYFGGRFRSPPNAVRGYASAQLTQTTSSFVAGWRAGRFRTYFDLVWMQ